MKLYEIPQQSKIRIYLDREANFWLKSSGFFDFTFHHVDGAYSVCTMDGQEERILHLSAFTPLELKGDHYEIVRET